MFMIVTVFLVLFVVTQANCPLPIDAEITNDVADYLQSQSNDAATPFTVTLSGPVQYTCLAQGTVRDTYTSYSVIAYFTSVPSSSVTLVHYQRRCNNGTWGEVGGDSFETSVPNNLQPPTRTNCFQCTNQLGDPHHCRQCNPPCPGSGRCTGFGAESCCPFFATDGTCTDDCTTSDGPNYSADITTNYTCAFRNFYPVAPIYPIVLIVILLLNLMIGCIIILNVIMFIKLKSRPTNQPIDTNEHVYDYADNHQQIDTAITDNPPYVTTVNVAYHTVDDTTVDSTTDNSDSI